MIRLEMAQRDEINRMQATVAQHHYLHRYVDTRCSIEAYTVCLVDGLPVGLLMFGRPEATRCGTWYGSVDDVANGKCEVTRWQVLNLARVWFSPDIQPGGRLHDPHYLPGYTDRKGVFRSTLASASIQLAAQQIGLAYLIRRPPCFLDEPYQIRYMMSYCDRRVHRGVIYKEAGFELYRTNERSIETWRLPLPVLTDAEDLAVREASVKSERSRRFRSEREALRSQASLFQEVA